MHAHDACTKLIHSGSPFPPVPMYGSQRRLLASLDAPMEPASSGKVPCPERGDLSHDNEADRSTDGESDWLAFPVEKGRLPNPSIRADCQKSYVKDV
jgi:hypothetical protein